MINGRKKGNKFEVVIVNWLKQLGYKAVSSRSESKNLDDKGVDIVDNTRFYFQCKAIERSIDTHSILARMPTDKIPVILHKRNKKGIVVSMNINDFEALLMYQNKKDIKL